MTVLKRFASQLLFTGLFAGLFTGVAEARDGKYRLVKANAAIEKTLSRRKISVNFFDTSLADAAEDIRKKSGLVIYLDSSAIAIKKRLTCRLKSTKVKNIFKRICGELDLDFKVSCGAVVIGKSKGLDRYPALPELKKGTKANADALATLASRRMSVNFNETPFCDVLAFLKDLSGLTFVQASPGKPVTLAARNISAYSAVNLITASGGLELRFACGVVVLGKPEVLARFPKAPRKVADKRLRKVMAQKIATNFSDTPLIDTIDFLRALLPMNFHLDPKLSKNLKVNLSSKSMSVGVALELICASLNIDFKPACGMIVIGASERLNSYPSAPKKLKTTDADDLEAIKRAKSAKLNLNFNDTTSSDVLSFIVDLTGLNCIGGKDFDGDHKVTIVAKSISVLEFLTMFAQAQGGKLELRQGVWMIHGA